MSRAFRVTLAAAAVVSCLQLGAASGFEGFDPTCRVPEYGQPDLFRNYWVDPTCGGDGAHMYIAPIPVPYQVGHVYYTYQPFMPHELLYKHKRSYHRYYDEGRGLTRTHIRWR